MTNEPTIEWGVLLENGTIMIAEDEGDARELMVFPTDRLVTRTCTPWKAP